MGTCCEACDYYDKEAIKMKCQGENCTYPGAVGFRKSGTKWLCDDCWGYAYGPQTCESCQRNCYEEDWDSHFEKYICNSCHAKGDAELDCMIASDIEYAEHQI